MNKFSLISLITNCVLAVAIIVLFVFVIDLKKEQLPCNIASEETISNDGLSVAYINIDSLLLKYTFAADANEELVKKQEDVRLTLNTKARTLQNEMAEFQRKLENNAFLSRERAEQEQQRLLRKQQELQELEAKLTENIMRKQQKMSEQLRDTVNNFLQDYNKGGKYQLIISNTANDNILYAEDGYDITNEIIAALNIRCNKK